MTEIGPKSYEEYMASLGFDERKRHVWNQCTNSILFKNSVIVLKYPKEDTSWNLQAMLKFIRNNSKAVVIDVTKTTEFANLDCFRALKKENVAEILSLPLEDSNFADFLQMAKIFYKVKEIKEMENKFVILLSAAFECWSLVAAGKMAGLSFSDMKEQFQKQCNADTLEGTDYLRPMYRWDKEMYSPNRWEKID